MKSFGVRLAAGIVTILFGAYAAAVAQKDKQNDPQAWAAQPPLLGQPAMPIAGMNEESWISQPVTDDPARELSELAANAFAVSDETPQRFSSAEIARVQHTEDLPDTRSEQLGGFDLAELPASLGAPEADPNPKPPNPKLPRPIPSDPCRYLIGRVNPRRKSGRNPLWHQPLT